MMRGTLKCPICGRPYKWYAHTVADQSACPKCVAEAEQSIFPGPPRSRWQVHNG